MPTSEQKIPNKPLSGEDVSALIRHEVREMVSKAAEDLEETLRAKLASDAVFGKTYSHPRVRIEIDLKFHFASIHMPPRTFQFASGQGPDPAKIAEADESSHFVEGTRRELTVDNPNAARQRAEVPVTLVEIQKPDPGKMFGEIHEHKIPVTGSPVELQPVDTDTTQQLAKEKRVPQDRRLRRP